MAGVVRRGKLNRSAIAFACMGLALAGCVDGLRVFPAPDGGSQQGKDASDTAVSDTGATSETGAAGDALSERDSAPVEDGDDRDAQLDVAPDVGQVGDTLDAATPMDVQDAPTESGTGNVSLVIAKDGNGSGTVTASWSGGSLNCGTSCLATVPQGTTVMFTAVPDMGSTVQWASPCSGSGSCSVSVPVGGAQIKATFTLMKLNLTIARTGSGTITGTGGISCADPSCVVSLDYGSSVMLTAAPSTGYDFGSWQGCSTASGATCTLNKITSAAMATATFTLKSASFNILRGGSGSGTVTASWSPGGGLSCPATCSASIAPGTQVSLTAMPDSCSTFQWGGACSGSGPCVVTVAATGTTIPVTFTAKACCMDSDCSGHFACVNGSCSTTICSTASGYSSCNNACVTFNTVDNCGSCGNSCLALDHVMGATCPSGTCASLRCTSGWGNCNPDPSDGCETDLTTTTNCRACGKVCLLAQSCGATACQGNTVDCTTASCAQSTCSTSNRYNVTNGIVVDLQNNRQLWQRASVTAQSRDAANALCRNLSIEGITGWRLPTEQELLGIILNGAGLQTCNAGYCCPATDQAAFSGTENNWYWSITDGPSGSGYVFVVDFGSGRVFHADPVTDGPLPVRCIHDPI